MVTSCAFSDALLLIKQKMRRVDDGVEGCARALYYQWTCKSIDDFKGVTLLELDELEDVIKIDIDVFEFKYKPPCLVPIRRSAYKHDDVLHLLLVLGCQFCYIKDIDAATKVFGCLKWGEHYYQRFR